MNYILRILGAHHSRVAHEIIDTIIIVATLALAVLFGVTLTVGVLAGVGIGWAAITFVLGARDDWQEHRQP